MKNGIVILGVLLLLVGGLFSLQGLGIVKGSMMTGQSLWLWVGLVGVVLGAAVIVRGLTLRAR
jgi:hypothetical protein